MFLKTQPVFQCVANPALRAWVQVLSMHPWSLSLLLLSPFLCLICLSVHCTGCQGLHSPGAKAQSMGAYPIYKIASNVTHQEDVSASVPACLPARLPIRRTSSFCFICLINYLFFCFCFFLICLFIYIYLFFNILF